MTRILAPVEHRTLGPRGRRHGMPLLVRFWLKVDVSAGFEGCWLWTAAVGSNGYGRMQVNDWGEPKRVGQAHRVAWELFNGPIPDGMEVCHRCDTPLCVNVGHLFLGTHQANVDDMVAKGRHRHGNLRGEQHPGAKLTAEDVESIRSRFLAGESGLSLASAFGIGPSQAYRIVRGESWAE